MMESVGDAVGFQSNGPVSLAFALYLVDWFLHRVYDELAGPLTDAITPPPPR